MSSLIGCLVVNDCLEESCKQVPSYKVVGSLSGRTVTTEDSYKRKKNFKAGVGPRMFEGFGKFLISASVFGVGAFITLAVGLGVGYSTNDWKKADTVFKVGAVGTSIVSVAAFASVK